MNKIQTISKEKLEIVDKMTDYCLKKGIEVPECSLCMQKSVLIAIFKNVKNNCSN